MVAKLGCLGSSSLTRFNLAKIHMVAKLTVATIGIEILF